MYGAPLATPSIPTVKMRLLLARLFFGLFIGTGALQQ